MTVNVSNLQIDSNSLWSDIHDTAQFGATAKGGVRRLTLSQEDKQVRDWFRAACVARDARSMSMRSAPCMPFARAAT